MSTDALLQTICIDYFYLAAGVLFFIAGVVSLIHSGSLNHIRIKRVFCCSKCVCPVAADRADSNACHINWVCNPNNKTCQFHLKHSFCTFMPLSAASLESWAHLSSWPAMFWRECWESKPRVPSACSCTSSSLGLLGSYPVSLLRILLIIMNACHFPTDWVPACRHSISQSINSCIAVITLLVFEMLVRLWLFHCICRYHNSPEAPGVDQYDVVGTLALLLG